jgi:hypothetical protein
MPADEQAKWRSPHGHAIASSETDKMAPSEFKKHRENCILIIENTKLKFQLAEAVKELCFFSDEANYDEGVVKMSKRARDFLAKIER